MSDKPIITEPNTDTVPLQASFQARHKARLQKHWYLWLNGPHVAACVATFALLIIGALTFTGTWARINTAGLTVTARTTVPQLKSAIAQKAESYKLPVKRVDGKIDSYGLSEMGIKVDDSASARQAVLAKHSGIWWERLQWWEQHDIPLRAQVDQTKFNAFMRDKITQTQKPYLNAIITVDDGEPVIHKSQVGEATVVSGGHQAVYGRVANLDTRALVQQKSRLTPRVVETDLKDDQQKLADILDNTFTFAVGNDTVTASPADIGRWIELTPDETSKKVAISINESAINSYVDSLAVPYATSSQASVMVDMPDGTSSLIFQGRGGGGVANKADVSRQLAQSVKANRGADFSLALDYDTTPVVHAAAADRWLLVDLTSKRMYAMEQNQIARTFLVSAGAPDTPTVTGKFNIYAKYTSQDMRGANADGSNYFQPNVQWINYFYRDYAVHGNYWRPNSYFGNTNSSHGCVGITNEQAEWIYNWTSIGTPVVVYG